MREELVSFETAKLAKEKNFNVSVNTYYDLSNVFTKDKKSLSEYTIPLNYNSRTKSPQFKEKCYISRPTRSLLQRWLREVHNIDILVTTINGRRLERYVSKIYINKLYKKLVGHSVIYEDTFEKGLQEALKSIKNEKL